MVCCIPLTRGQVALVEDADAHLADRRWVARPIGRRTGGFYAYRSEGARTVYMHRLILNAPKGALVDHINGDGLDNRRANLRLATPGQNLANRATTGRSGYRGVMNVGHPHRPWLAYICVDRRRRDIGFYATAEEAASAYDSAASARYGEFARLNATQQET